MSTHHDFTDFPKVSSVHKPTNRDERSRSNLLSGFRARWKDEANRSFAEYPIHKTRYHVSRSSRKIVFQIRYRNIRYHSTPVPVLTLLPSRERECRIIPETRCKRTFGQAYLPYSLAPTFVNTNIYTDRSSGKRLFAGGSSCRLRYNRFWRFTAVQVPPIV